MHYSPYTLRGPDAHAAKDLLLANSLGILETYTPGFKSLVVAAEVLTPLSICTLALE